MSRLNVWGVGLCLVAGPFQHAWGHTFGARYDLPLPLWMFLAGAGGAVALSFAVMAIFLRPQQTAAAGRLSFPLANPLSRLCTNPLTVNTARFVSVCLLVLTIVTGWLGEQNTTENFWRRSSRDT